MSDATRWLAVYLINSAWQIPVLAACTAGLLRVAVRSGAKLEYRLWVGCLVLAIVLPAFPSMERVRTSSSHRVVSSRVVMTSGHTEHVASASDRIAMYANEIAEFARKTRTSRALLCLYALSVLAGSVRLSRRLAVTGAVVRGASRMPLPPSISGSLFRSTEAL